jgi:predicted small metal-binding protein
MSYSIRCADSGADCPGAFTTATEDELIEHLQVHARVAHPDMEMTPETLADIKGLIKVSPTWASEPSGQRGRSTSANT